MLSIAENLKPQKTLIWDLPMRLVHWLMAGSFVIAYMTAEDNRFLFVHVNAGYLFFYLILFRILWGFVGNHFSRFSSFTFSLTSALDYFKAIVNGDANRYLGHNPVGSWAIYLIFALGTLLSVSGILVFAGEEGHGIFAPYVSYFIGELSKTPHELMANGLFLIIIVHVMGVIFESYYHHENLVAAMFHGKKMTQRRNKEGKFQKTGIALFMLVVILGLYVFKGYINETEEFPFAPYTSDPLPTNALWKEECGDCHLAYHPVLLPARSWVELMIQQQQHFDEDLDLDKETVEEITKFLVKYSAESKLNEPARKILSHEPKSKTPIRVIATQYWKEKHHEIKNDIWSDSLVQNKGNCEACHLDANQGWFEDSAMRIPTSRKGDK